MVSVNPIGFSHSRRQIIHYDFIIFFATISLIVCGILFIYSSGISPVSENNSNEYLRQLIWAISGLFLLVFFSIFNYKRLKSFALYAYFTSILLLIIVLLFGKEVNGARSWLGIGSLGIQPSEFAKLSLILYLSGYLENNGEHITSVRVLAGALLLAFPLVLLTLLQPDLGTAMVFIPITLAVCFISGSSRKHLIFCSATTLLVCGLVIIPEWILLRSTADNIPIANIITHQISLLLICTTLILICVIAFIGFRRFRKTYFYWIGYVSSLLFVSVLISAVMRNFLKEYQVLRLAIFIDPYLDPRGAGWNVIQSITAIGSGGLFGKGFLNGTHSQYDYLPQLSTDFIFSIIGEEWGFVGGVVVLSLLLVIVLRAISIISRCHDQFGVNVGVGIVCLILFHFTVNVGMTMGIMPVTGIPFLLLSHGGSALWVTMVSIGILINIHQNQIQTN